MHLLVAVDEVVILASLSKAALTSEKSPQVVEIIIVQVVARVAHRDPLQGLPNGDQLSKLGRRQVAHDQLAPRSGLQKPLLTEGVESVPDKITHHAPCNVLVVHTT